MPNQNQAVNLEADFVLSMLPTDYLEALRVLAKMNFPINDRSGLCFCSRLLQDGPFPVLKGS
jgi:hypothetical protein